MTSDYVIELIRDASNKKSSFLDLGNCGLKELPEELRMLAPFLKELNLGTHYWKNGIYIESKNTYSANNFFSTSFSLTLLEYLPKLKALYISKTEIRIRYLEFNSLSQLKILDVSNNRIRDVDIAPLSELKQLTILNISGNEIREKGAQVISGLTKLTTLSINNCKVGKGGAFYVSNLLKLSYLEITANEIGDEGLIYLSELNNLQYLNVGSNNITSKGTENISRLIKLISLKIGFGNDIGDTGAENISKLVNLVDLDVFKSGLTNIGIGYISKLSKLTSLNVSHNKITDYGAKLLSSLINLSLLSIYYTDLSDSGVKQLAKLVNLVSLHIGHNRIRELDSIRLLVLNLPYLRQFHFDNYITHSVGLDQEIAGNLQTLRAYFSSTQRVKNNLVKMVLVGNTTAGKSSLADFLVNNHYKEARISTHGIHLWRWKIGQPQSDLQVNIWDFGGQDYYHATHNLFLGDKTLFLLLHTSKEEYLSQDGIEEAQYLPVNYWLGNIRSITRKDSAIWYIQSKAEDERFNYLPTELVKRYGVSGQYKISVKWSAYKELSHEDDFNYFRKKLLEELNKSAKGELPISWIIIRDKFLPKWREKNLFLSKEEFEIKCTEVLKSKKNLLNDLKVSWDGLLPYLRSCGEIVQFDRKSLEDKIFLSTENLTKGVYNILSKKVLEQNGEFTLATLKETDRENGEVYLRVLKSFQIIFEKPGETGHYVAPQYLPENPYTQYFQELIKIAYVIRFPDYMPRSIVTRFLVEYAGSSEQNYYWKYGAFFELYEVKSFVRIDIDQQKVYIHVSDGKEKYFVIKELFFFFTLPEDAFYKSVDVIPTPAMVQKNILPEPRLEKLTEGELKKVVPDEIEISLNDTDFACVRDIRDALDIKAYKLKSKQGNLIEFNATIHQLLNTNVVMPKKVFLSYSHKDEVYKAELDNHFAALKRSGKVETWQDRKILAGSDWDKSIEDALLDSDIALLLLSPDFMSSDYIWNVEIPKAIDNGVYIVPIFIRPCDFSESEFEVYKMQGLPSDTKWIVSSRYQYRDEAYLEVVNGVKALL